MVAMQTQTLDEAADDDDVTAHRARAAAMLDRIAQEAKQALADQGIAIDLFFLIPNSGHAILIYGTPADPPDDQWSRVSNVVASVVRQTVGLRGTRRREVQCATTGSAADHQPLQSPVQPTEPSGLPAGANFHTNDAAYGSREPMRYREITPDRFQLSPSHPHMVEVVIDPVNWSDLQRMADDNMAIRILGHDTPCDGRMTVYVACSSAAVRDRLEDGWG
jgi:hypothetical protein